MSGVEGQGSWHIFGVPDAVRAHLPTFDQPIEDGPWLVVIFPDSRAFVFARNAMVAMIYAGINTLNQIVASIEKVPPP